MRLVIPFATPQYNWANLQTVYKQFKKPSPTKTVESQSIGLTQPSAFLAVFKDRDLEWVKSHVSLSFLIIFPSSMVRDFEEYLFMIDFHSLLYGEMGIDLLLATGTLEHWVQALNILERHCISTYTEVYIELKAYLRKYEA